MFWNRYPYTDFHELNLDWILSTIKEIKTQYNRVESGIARLDDIETYVKDYIDGLDWQLMANEAMQALYDGGQLAGLIAEYIASDVTPTIDDLRERIDNFQSFQGAMISDSSSTEVHNTFFCYIRNAPGDTTEHAGTREDPFTSLDQAFEMTLNKGFSAPAFRFVEGGSYSTKYCIFNGVTIHLSIASLPNRVQVHFTTPHNVVWYNCHCNWRGIECYIDTPGYTFYGENSQLHFEDCQFNVQLGSLSCGCHLIENDFEAFNASNSSVRMEGNHYFTPTVNASALRIHDNSRVTITGTLTFNASQYTGDLETNAIWISENGDLYLRPESPPVITPGYDHEIYLRNGSTLKVTASNLEGINLERTGITTLQQVAQTVN